MDQPPKTRRACDRCHTQKLRCKRIEGKNYCVRCTRAELTCIFSPPGKNQKQASSSGRNRTASTTQKNAFPSNQNESTPYGLLDVDKRHGEYSQLQPLAAMQQWSIAHSDDDILLNGKYNLFLPFIVAK
jgi:Fungal Zn(2)-Cys(6) binuclear cluster domain